MDSTGKNNENTNYLEIVSKFICLFKEGNHEGVVNYYLQTLEGLDDKKEYQLFYELYFVFLNFGCESIVEELVDRKLLPHEWQRNSLRFLINSQNAKNYQKLVQGTTRTKRFYLGIKEFIMNNYERAKQLFLSVQPQNEEVLKYLMVISYRERNDEEYHRLIELYNEQYEVDVDSPIAILKRTAKRGIVNKLMAELELALKFRTEMNLSYPIINFTYNEHETKPVYRASDINQIYKSNYLNKKHFQSVQFFREVVEHYPSWNFPWVLLGNSYNELHEHYLAYKAYKEASLYSNGSNKEKALFRFAEFCEGNSYVLEALNVYKEMIRSGNHSYRVLNKMYELILRLTKYSEHLVLYIDEELSTQQVLRELKELLLVCKENNLCNIKLHYCLRELFEYENSFHEALHEYKVLYELDRKVISFREIGIWALYHGLNEEARDIFRSILDEEPDNRIATIGLELIKMREHNEMNDERVWEIIGVMARRKPPLEMLIRFESECVEAEDYDRGVKAFQLLADLFPEDVGINRIYATFLSLLGEQKNDYDMLEEAYQKYLYVLQLKASPKLLNILLLYCFKNRWPERAEALWDKYAHIIDSQLKPSYKEFYFSVKSVYENIKHPEELLVLDKYCDTLRRISVSDIIEFLKLALTTDFFKHEQVYQVVQGYKEVNLRKKTFVANLIPLFIQGEFYYSSRNIEVLDIFCGDMKNILLHSKHQYELLQEYKITDIMYPLFHNEKNQYETILMNAFQTENKEIIGFISACLVGLHDNKWVSSQLFHFIIDHQKEQELEEILDLACEIVPMQEIYCNIGYLYFEKKDFKQSYYYYSKSMKKFGLKDHFRRQYLLTKLLSGYENGKFMISRYELEDILEPLDCLLHEYDETEIVEALQSEVTESKNEVLQTLLAAIQDKQNGRYEESYDRIQHVREKREELYMKFLSLLKKEMKKRTKYRMNLLYLQLCNEIHEYKGKEKEEVLSPL